MGGALRPLKQSRVSRVSRKQHLLVDHPCKLAGGYRHIAKLLPVAQYLSV